MSRRYTTTDINDFLDEAWGGAKNLGPDADILDVLGITGDDTDNVLSGYAKQFNVDMSGYLWYFNTESEAAVANSIYVAPYERLGGRIIITTQMLVDFAHKGFWDITYPEHEFPFKESKATNVARYVMLALMGGIALFFTWYNYMKP